jgi:hypothetical protein
MGLPQHGQAGPFCRSGSRSFCGSAEPLCTASVPLLERFPPRFRALEPTAGPDVAQALGATNGGAEGLELDCGLETTNGEVEFELFMGRKICEKPNANALRNAATLT